MENNDIKGCMDEINSRVRYSVKSIKNNQKKSNDIHDIIKKQNVKNILEKIPSQVRIKKRVSDALDLSELSYIEAQIDDHPKRHK